MGEGLFKSTGQNSPAYLLIYFLIYGAYKILTCLSKRALQRSKVSSTTMFPLKDSEAKLLY